MVMTHNQAKSSSSGVNGLLFSQISIKEAFFVFFFFKAKMIVNSSQGQRFILQADAWKIGHVHQDLKSQVGSFSLV